MWTKAKPLAALLITYIAGEADEGSAKFVRAAKKAHRLRPRNSDITTMAKAGKVGKQICLEFATLEETKVKGSSDPIGADGPNGVGACLATPPTGLCCPEAFSCYTPFPNWDLDGANCTAYFDCLEDPANGPVYAGDWWLQRDVSDGEMFFDDDAVCGRISSTALNSRTRFELWDDTVLGKGLGLFRKFTVDYDVRSSTASNNGYLNMYLRSADNVVYYDCRFDFSIPDAVGTGTLEVTLDTEGTAVPYSSGTNAGTSCNNALTTLRAYLDANPNAVMGVGNGEPYTFVLNTGSTNEDNSGQETCWSDVAITRNDDTGATFVDAFEFTTI